MKILRIFILAVVFYTMSYCQSDEWINYSGPSQINSLASEGEYLWIGTDINLTTMNVSSGELKIFSNSEIGISEAAVAAIAVDHEGNKWIGKKGGGLAKYDGKTWTILNYPALEIPDHGLNSIAVDPKGNKWIATFAGLTKYDDKTWTQYTTANSGLPSNAVYSVAFDSAGNKWIGTSEGLVKFDDTSWSVYNTSNSSLPVNYVRPVAIDHNGNIWMGNSSNGLVKFDGTNWKVFDTKNSSLPADFIYSIFIDAQGNKWFGTESGLAKYDDNSWTVYKTFSSGKQINKVSSITGDQTGNVWIGTENSLAKYDNSTWKEYNYGGSGLPDNNVRLIVADLNGKKWMLAGEGVTAFDGKTWTTYITSNSGLPTNSITTIAIDNIGNKWFGTQNGKIIKFNGQNWTTYNLPVQDIVRAITFDTKGNLWVGLAGSGVLKYDNNSWTTYNNSNSGLPRNDILALAADMNGNIWAGSYHGSLVKFDGTSWTPFSIYFSTRVISADRKGNVWIRADENKPILASYDGSAWTSYTIPVEGSGVITAIDFDPAGNKWIGLALDGLIKFDDYNWTLYNTSNSGIISNDVNTVAVDPAGNKWIGGYSGLSVFKGGGEIIIHPPAAPKLISAANHSKDQPLSLTLSWGKSSGADTYHLMVSGDSMFKDIAVNDSALADTVKEVKGLKEGLKFYWKVCSQNTAGKSPYSDVWNFTTILYAPESLAAAVQNNKKISLSWTDKSENETGFVIERKQGADFTSIDTVKADVTSCIDSTAAQAATFQYRVKAYTPFASSAYSNTVSVTLTGVDELVLIPKEYSLFQNYPNPFNPVTTIRYWLPVKSFVEIKIMDMLGRMVMSLVNKEQDEGEYNYQFNALGLPSGVYIYTINAGGFRDSKKFILLK